MDVPCPACESQMASWPLDPQLSGAGYRGIDPQIFGCHSCGGAWVDRRTLDAILEAAQAQATNVDARMVPRRTMVLAEAIVYRPCPRCRERMHRRNFGRYSGIVIDECSRCGAYFDAGELEGVVSFVRAGGLGLTRQREADEALRDLALRKQLSGPPVRASSMRESSGSTLEAELELLMEFLRWIGRWLRRLAR